MKCCTILILSLLLVCGACAAPRPGSALAQREESFKKTCQHLVELEQRRPDNFRATWYHLDDLLAGDPDKASATARHIFELD